jgi:hypothetical protein
MTINCPGCNASYTVSAKHSGLSFVCQKCSAKITVPQMEVTKPTTPAPIPVPVPSPTTCHATIDVPMEPPSAIPTPDVATMDDALEAMYYISWIFTLAPLFTFACFSVFGLSVALLGYQLDKKNRHDFRKPGWISGTTMAIMLLNSLRITFQL